VDCPGGAGGYFSSTPEFHIDCPTTGDRQFAKLVFTTSKHPEGGTVIARFQAWGRNNSKCRNHAYGLSDTDGWNNSVLSANSVDMTLKLKDNERIIAA